MILVLGSTVCVTPACDLVRPTQSRILAIVNRQKTALDSDATVRAFGDCDPWTRRLMRGLLPEDGLKVWEAGRAARMQQYDLKRTL